jgi:hypothetical protein
MWIMKFPKRTWCTTSYALLDLQILITSLVSSSFSYGRTVCVIRLTQQAGSPILYLEVKQLHVGHI